MMTVWEQRSVEEKALLNPCFCANLIWHAAKGYQEVNPESLSFEESFLILPFVLHRETRESLPSTIRTSLAVWLGENTFARSRVARRAQYLLPFTREAILFGGLHGFLNIEGGCIYANLARGKLVKHVLDVSSEEVNQCTKKAAFVGKWFGQSGNPAIVLALMGVCP